MTDILISLKPRYVEMVLSGSKTIELRSRKINIDIGAKVWIYSTLPKACIEAVATVADIDYDKPELIWEKYQHGLSISYEEFIKYVNGNDRVSAVKICNASRFEMPLSLRFIRSIQPFQPPQFFTRLYDNMPLAQFLSELEIGTREECTHREWAMVG